ncbi:putative nucleic acid-binding Zn ribbon protein [Pseudomonas sp. UYEF17]
MKNHRVCCICNKSLINRRRDSTTCSSSCRGKLFRSNKTKTVLVKFRVPNDIYTDIAINAFIAKQGIDQYLTGLVMTA